MTSALDILLERGRGYLYRGKYPQIVVFTKSVAVADKLKAEFGGHVYRHSKGYVWMISNRRELAALKTKLGDNTKSCWHFENIL